MYLNEKIFDLTSKFPDGEERYKKNALFHKVIDALAYGADIYDILDQVLKASDSATNALGEYIKNSNSLTHITYVTEEEASTIFNSLKNIDKHNDWDKPLINMFKD